MRRSAEIATASPPSRARRLIAPPEASWRPLGHGEGRARACGAAGWRARETTCPARRGRATQKTTVTVVVFGRGASGVQTVTKSLAQRDLRSRENVTG